MKLDPSADRENLHRGQAAFVDGVDVGGSFVHHPVTLERKTVGLYHLLKTTITFYFSNKVYEFFPKIQ